MDPRSSEAFCSDNTAVFHSLISEDPHILDRVSLTSLQNPLHIATFTGKIEIIREILRRKPGFAVELNEDGFSPLHIASANGNVEIVREILKVGSGVCLLKGKDGKIPLHCAAMKGRFDVIEELVSSCPNSVKEVTASGETALHLAVKYSQFEAVKTLIQEIKKLEMVEIVDWKDGNGNTILHLAAFRRQLEILNLLIGKDAVISGVDVNAANSTGFTPKDVLDFTFQIGQTSNDLHIFKLFQQSGAISSENVQAIHPVFPQNLERNIIKSSPKTSASVTNLWKELMKEVEEASTETQNALMLVAVLIATVTYQAILSPPSGFVSAETRKSPTVSTFQRREALPGEATMSTDPEVFVVFTIFNAIGFFASLAMISLLTSGFPLRAGLRLAILSMTATYVIAAFYMAPTTVKTVVIVVGLMGLLVVAEFARFTVWLVRKWGVIPVRKRTVRSHPEDVLPHV